MPPQASDWQNGPTFFCRALYDYQADDSTYLHFRKGDIIRVLTCLETGWWDGLLGGDQRGWFPSKYATMISDEEANAALTDVSTAFNTTPQSDTDADWLNGDAYHFETTQVAGTRTGGSMDDGNNFWLPRISQDGRIFYINTQTGQHSADLPTEGDSKISTLSSHIAGLGAIAETPDHTFGLPLKAQTPEPWVRRLADNGLLYYLNRLDGSISWTFPEPAAPSSYSQEGYSGPLALASKVTLSSSDTSNAFRPRGEQLALSWTRMESESSGIIDGHSVSTDMDSTAIGAMHSLLDIHKTGGEQLTDKSASALQNALSPYPPATLLELSNRVRESVAAILRYLQGSFNLSWPDGYRAVDGLVVNVAAAVRDLLYVTSTPSGHVPYHLYPRDPRDPRPAIRTHSLSLQLKTGQRKVAGTVSKLVLSTLALRYDPALSSSTTERPNRIESDVLELEREVATFVQEVESVREHHGGVGPGTGKRLFGVFSTANIGLGLPGAGIAGNWLGFGYVPVDEKFSRVLDDDISFEFKAGLKALEALFGSLVIALKDTDSNAEQISSRGQKASAYLSSMLRSLCGVHIASHVDIDGVHPDPSPQYKQTVTKAHQLIRVLEAATQALYDDGAVIFMVVQSLANVKPSSWQDRTALVKTIETIAPAIRSNYVLITQTLESLFTIGQGQMLINREAYRKLMQWRSARADAVDDAPTKAMPLETTFASASPNIQTTESISLDSKVRDGDTNYHPPQDGPNDSDAKDIIGALSPEPISLTEEDLAEPLEDDDDPPLIDTSPSRRDPHKIKKILGEVPPHIIEIWNAGNKPWYLRSNYDASVIRIDPDGHVRAGTPEALIERLTQHETTATDIAFARNFMMTFKSFMTLDDLFELLTRRFWITPPPNLKPKELEEWIRLKQKIVRTRVLKIFIILLTDDDVLEKEDLYILPRIKEFVSNQEIVNLPAAKQVLIQIERAQRNAPVRTTYTAPVAPPAPIIPRTFKKIKLLDIDPLELARQLTLMEAALYKTIRPIECLQRSRETKPGKTADHITTIIHLSNKIADWVAESILVKEDSQRRARIIKQFISVADRCRTLQNFSSMTAIFTGLNRPPVRRLKRTWEQVNQRYLSQLQMCESTVDTNKNFNNYRSILTRIAPPCVPFIGMYLTTLTFINDGAGDRLNGDMINFRKRQKAAEIIQDMKRWQSVPYNFQTVPSILAYLEDSFQAFKSGVDYGDQFWDLSLEREPREREDEKMARLLQESGFL